MGKSYQNAGPREKLGLLVALAIVVVIVIALTARNSTEAIILIVAVLSLAYAATSLSGKQKKCKRSTRLCTGGEGSACARLTQSDFDTDLLEAGDPKGFTGSFCPAAKASSQKAPTKRERFAPYTALPGPEAPYAAATDSRDIDVGAELPAERLDDYPGAIEADDYDVDSAGGPAFAAGFLPTSPDVWPESLGDDTVPSMPDMTDDDAWATGHKDRLENSWASTPEGNPFDLNRTEAPKAAEPCEDDDAYGVLDADEMNTYQARARNDATRVTAGTMRRLREMDKYFREELEEREDLPWWGRHEI